MGPSVFKTFLF